MIACLPGFSFHFSIRSGNIAFSLTSKISCLLRNSWPGCGGHTKKSTSKYMFPSSRFIAIVIDPIASMIPDPVWTLGALEPRGIISCHLFTFSRSSYVIQFPPAPCDWVSNKATAVFNPLLPLESCHGMSTSQIYRCLISRRWYDFVIRAADADSERGECL
jgi:hypothetical protein